MCEFIHIISHHSYEVSMCSSCNALEIVVGTCVIRMSANQWESFLEYIHRVKETHVGVHLHRKTIMLDIASTESFQMYLSIYELDQLIILLEKADDEIKAQELLNYFRPRR